MLLGGEGVHAATLAPDAHGGVQSVEVPGGHLRYADPVVVLAEQLGRADVRVVREDVADHQAERPIPAAPLPFAQVGDGRVGDGLVERHAGGAPGTGELDGEGNLAGGGDGDVAQVVRRRTGVGPR